MQIGVGREDVLDPGSAELLALRRVFRPIRTLHRWRVIQFFSHEILSLSQDVHDNDPSV
jgi:hypothetical protein